MEIEEITLDVLIKNSKAAMVVAEYRDLKKKCLEASKEGKWYVECEVSDQTFDRFRQEGFVAKDGRVSWDIPPAPL